MDRTLVQIRERNLIDLMDLALVLVRNRPGTLGLAALVGIGPFLALNAWLFSSVPEIAPGVPLFLWLVEAPMATAPLTLVLGDLMFGKRISVGRMASTLARSAIPLIIVHGLFRNLLFFLIPSRLVFTNEVILLERGHWWKVFRRGGDLCSGRSGEIFLLMLLQFGLVYLVATLFYVGTGNAYRAVMAEGLTWDAPQASTFTGLRYQLPIWLVVAFFGIVRFLVYIDQRIRLEGWELELRLRAVGQSLEESRRW